tara:strand:- start:40 stop:567 length:528 start_codon:yes stop_codon:yes gene_type:complete
MKSFTYEVDRGTSSFLNIKDFIYLRSTCRVHYDDSEAWEIKSLTFPINIATLNTKKKLGLHYLLALGCKFKETTGSVIWFKKIVNWLQYNVSIKIMSIFMYQQRVMDFDLSELCLRRRFVWQRQFHCKNTRLLKVCIGKRKRNLEDEYKLEDSSKKRLWENSFLNYPDFEHIEAY